MKIIVQFYENIIWDLEHMKRITYAEYEKWETENQEILETEFVKYISEDWISSV